MADIHLGYRAYNRTTSTGLNLREADIFRAFQAALAKTLEIAPDVVIIAGDLFHSVRPSNLCIQYTFREFVRFREQTSVPVVIIGGNHDSPRSVETGCVLDILGNIQDIHIIHREYTQLDLPSLSVFGLCHQALPHLSNFKIEPNPGADYNVLTVHGTVEGIARNLYDSVMISPSQVLQDNWNYIAFGHYHVHTKLANNAYYSGSLEYSSFNIWSEIEHPKGIVEYDLDNRVHTFHPLETRKAIDLRVIDAEGMTAESVNNLVNARVQGIEGGLEDKIVRLVVENIPRSVQADLDFDVMRQYRQQAVHFDLQLRAPKSSGARSADSDHNALPLEEEWREFVKLQEVPGGVNKDKLLELGLGYIGREEQTVG